jgi:hypothetical protein
MRMAEAPASGYESRARSHKAATMPAPRYVNHVLTVPIHLASGAGARWSNGMSKDGSRADANPLSAFVLMIGGAMGAALPMTILIIWVCS